MFRTGFRLYESSPGETFQILKNSFARNTSIREGYHEHIYCRTHRRYLRIGEEKCYKCQEEYEERSLEIREEIVTKIIAEHAYKQIMEGYHKELLKQAEEMIQSKEKALK